MIKTTILLLLTLVFAGVYSQNSFEFHGKINVDGGKRQGVKIVVTKNGKPFKTFKPEGSGKYSFFLDYNSDYIISYEKPGFVSKKVEINTQVPDKILADNKFRYKWKTDVNLFKEYEGIDFSFFKDPIQKIYFDKSSSRFDYDNRYAKKIEKELKAKMKEIEERKAEEARKAEEERKRKEAARQKAIRDSIRAEKQRQAALLAEQKRLKKEREAARRDSILRVKKERERIAAEKKRQAEEARAAKLLAAKQAAEAEAKRKEEERQRKQAELEQKRKEEAARKEAERLERERKLKEEAEKAKARREAEEAARKARIEAARLAAIEANKKNKVQEIFTDNYKKVIKITVTQGKKINIYKKVQWNWGGVYYFKNEKNISRSLFYKETK